jgi:hypothetical protein
VRPWMRPAASGTLAAPILNNEWARPPRGNALPFRDVSLSQYVRNFSRFFFWQFHDRITQVLGWALGLSVPHHPAAPSTSSDKEEGKVWFVGHFVLSLRTFSRVVIATTVRFSSGRSKAYPFSIPATPKAARPPRASMVGRWGVALASFCFRRPLHRQTESLSLFENRLRRPPKVIGEGFDGFRFGQHNQFAVGLHRPKAAALFCPFDHLRESLIKSFNIKELGLVPLDPAWGMRCKRTGAAPARRWLVLSAL